MVPIPKSQGDSESVQKPNRNSWEFPGAWLKKSPEIARPKKSPEIARPAALAKDVHTTVYILLTTIYVRQLTVKHYGYVWVVRMRPFWDPTETVWDRYNCLPATLEGTSSPLAPPIVVHVQYYY